MTRRILVFFVCVVPLLLWAGSRSSAQLPTSDRAKTLHQDALVFDAHVHVVDRQFYHG